MWRPCCSYDLGARKRRSRATHVAVADTTSDPNSSNTGGVNGARARSQSPSEQLADTLQMVKAYARQETVDPLKSAGRWIGFGLAGAICIGLATALLTLGLVRLVQFEWPGTFGGRWTSLLPYLFGFVLCAIVAGLALMRINKDPLTKEKR